MKLFPPISGFWGSAPWGSIPWEGVSPAPPGTIQAVQVLAINVEFGAGSVNLAISSLYVLEIDIDFGEGALTVQPFITVFVDGKDITTITGPQGQTGGVQRNSVSITNPLSQPTTATFSVWDPTGELDLQVGQEVEIFLGSVKIFGGCIDQPFQTAFQANPGAAYLGTPGGSGSGGTSSATSVSSTQSSGSGSGAVQCTDWQMLLSRRYIGLYFDGHGSPAPTFLSDIVEYIVENFLASDGFTYDDSDGDPGINLGPTLFNWVTIQAAFNTLSSSTGWDFTVDPYKVIRFFATSYEAAPFNVTEGDGNAYAESLGVQYMRSTYRNRQGVVSPSQQGQLWSDVFSASDPGPFPNFPQPPDGVRQTFLQLYGFTAIPIVTVNGAPQVVAELTPSGFVPMTGWQWYIVEPQPNLPSYGLFQYGPDAPLTSSDTLVIEYPTPISPILWLQNDAQIAARAAIEGNTGVYEDVEQAPSTTDPAAIAIYCAGLLARYSDGIPFQVTYSSRTQKPIFAGQSQTINTTNPPLSFTGAISQVNWQDIDGVYFQLSITVQSGIYVGNYTQFFAALVAGTALAPPSNTNAYQWGPITTGVQNYQSPQVSLIRGAVEAVLFFSVNFTAANPAPCELDFSLLINGTQVLQLSYPNGSSGPVTIYPTPGSIKMNQGDVATIEVFFSVLFLDITDVTVNLYNVVLSS